MKKFVLALALAVGVMMMAAMPALAAKPVPPPAPPAPALLPGGTTTAACPIAEEVVVSGTAVYSFKGKNKVTMTSYVEGEFNTFGEPTTATFTTPLEPRFDTVKITLVCAPATAAPPDADSDGVPDASDNCPTTPNPGQENLDNDPQGDACDTDDDQDSWFDWQDNCPTVQGTDQGCPEAVDGVFVSSGPVSVPGGDEIGIQCPSGYKFLGGSATYHFVGYTSLAIAFLPPQGIVAENQGTSTMTGTLSMTCVPIIVDTDNDGVPDASDNCPAVFNPGQEDTDGDSIGDACDLPDVPQVVHVESGDLALDNGDGFDLLCPAGYYHDTSTLALNFPFGINWNVITRSDGDGYLYGVRAENRVQDG